MRDAPDSRRERRLDLVERHRQLCANGVELLGRDAQTFERLARNLTITNVDGEPAILGGQTIRDEDDPRNLPRTCRAEVGS
jgi:hypothetical protein